MRIGFVSSSIWTGIWSLPTLGPCEISLLKILSRLFPKTRSGLPFFLPLWKVWKSGPRKSRLYNLQIWYSNSPLWLLVLLCDPKKVWLALKSPAMSNGTLIDMSFWKSSEFIPFIAGRYVRCEENYWPCGCWHLYCYAGRRQIRNNTMAKIFLN